MTAPNDPRKPLDISETNMALCGTDLEKKLRKAQAENEPAWATAGKAPGIEIWRMEKFTVVPWPKAQYGSFYDGDSYIVLETTRTKSGEGLQWDIYFWLGKYTTLDEAGTAAFKTVELDDFFNGTPVEHREVQGWETEAFLKLFPEGLTILKGGIDSGFKHVEAGQGVAAMNGEPTLYHVAGPSMRTVRITACPATLAQYLSESDCFVLDTGAKDIFAFQGETASPGEKNKASSYANKLATARSGKATVCNSKDAPEAFWKAVGGKPEGGVSKDTCAEIENANLNPASTSASSEPAKLIHITDRTGSLETNTVAEGDDKIKGYNLDSTDCYVLVDGASATCWCGSGSTKQEKSAALQHTQRLISTMGNPRATITRLVEGRETPQFVAKVMA